LPIGNGQAPGIEIGRDAAGAELGVELAVDGDGDLETVAIVGRAFAATMAETGFFAAIVFVGFLAAFRAAGFVPAAFFFATGFVELFARRAEPLAATLLADFRFADCALVLADFARFRGLALRARVSLADRATALRTDRFAAFLDADFFLAAIPAPPIVKRRIGVRHHA
jgi:hypothetical protein